MNKERKARIQEVITKINGCADDLSDIKFDEDYARDNIPENLQGGDAYCTSEDCSDKIEDAISDLRQVASDLGEIT